jgi:hypothetical protein
MEQSSITYILILMIIVIIIKLYIDADFFQLKCIVSSVDGNKYCVRERKKLKQSADLLARVSVKMKSIVNYMYKTYPNKENVQRLKEGFNPKKICETLPTSEFTAYSENKGEKLAFCLNRRKNGTRLIDENTLTFVALHELSHIMSATVGHNDEFWGNFKFLLENAIKQGIYKPVDYKKNPQPYCGMDITDNPYYDM